MKVGDLVIASYWKKNQTAIVVDVRRLDWGVVTVHFGFGWEIDQLAKDLEVISESR